MSSDLLRAKPPTIAPSAKADFLAGGGEMGARMRAFDWSRTPLGAADSWPQSLKTIVRMMLDSRYAMWMLWGPDLTFFCNDAYLPTVGLKRDWVLGARSDKVWEEIWPDVGPRIEQVLRFGESTWDESLQLFLERSGFPEETYHTFSYSPVYDDDSRIAGMLCVVTEVTERVIGERNLLVLRDLAARTGSGETAQEACRRLCGTLAEYPLDVAFAGFYLLDPDSTEARCVARTRVVPESVLPSRLGLDARSPWPIARLLETHAMQEVRHLPQLGLLVPAGPWPDPVQSAVVLPLRRAAALPLSGFLILGVSPRRALDETYRSFLTLIAGQVAAAVADAHAYEAERRRAEALAEIDRAKTVFFSNVSHEFRTPLTLLLGPLEDALAADPGDLPRQRGELEIAHRNGLRLLKLVNSLLDFSRIEAGRLRAVFEPVDLAALTRDLASVFRSAIERAGLRLSIECGEISGETWVDRDMWEKIVLNLVSNAFKYTEHGEIQVRLEGVGDHAELIVRDTGVGIAPEAQAHLFERFYRVPGVRGRTQEGTGIGLSLVDELVRQHGGSIRVVSQPGAGSVFTVSLPTGRGHLPAGQLATERSQSPAPATARSFVAEALRWLPAAADDELIDTQLLRAHPEVPGAPASAPLLSAPLIVLADDNADMREYVGRLLAPHYRVRAVADGQEALEVIRGEHPDLVLSDVMMPRLDGFALLQAVRADATIRDTPVVLLSARAGEEARVVGLGAGADDYLIKPFSARELLARISSQLALARLRRETQAALRESERRFRVALASSAVGFTIMGAVRDTSGEVLDFSWRYVNSTAERLIGSSADKLQGRRISEVLPQLWGAVPGLITNFVAVLEDGVPRDVEIAVEISGARLWYHNSITRLDDGVVVWFTDVTERRRAEAELRDADRRKDEFLAMLAHELRNPLAPIRNAVDLIARLASGADPRVHEALALAGRQVTQLTRLVDDLLDVSRITRGRIELQRAPIELSLMVTQALETVQPLMRAKRHDLSVTTAGGEPLYVSADSARLVQCLVNVLMNAAKYSDAGSEIRILTRREGSGALIEIADTGAGIAPELLPYVFDLFVQGDRTLDRSQGGLGVGLAVVKQLIEMHDGTVSIHSDGVGRGATVRIRLPVIEAAHVATPEPATFKGASVRIMIVDDNQDSANSLAALLRLDGHQTEVAYSGAAALERAAAFQPSIVLLDIGLPGMDGYEVARRMRAVPALAGVRLFAVTGYGQSEDERRAYAAGFDAHLIKPVDLAHLERLILERTLKR